MTAEDLIRELRELVTTHRHLEALDLTTRVLPQIRPTITSEQVVRIAELMHIAQMSVDREAWDAANGRAGTVEQQATTSPTEVQARPSHSS
jgi:hypothetical protein